MNLRGKVVLITGSSRGLGFALARAFARKGSRVVLCARNEDQLAQARQSLEAEGARVLTVPCDLTDREQVRNMIRQTVETLGRIDILVNNAGVIQVGPMRQMQVDDFKQSFDVNFWGTLYPTLEALPYMTAAANRGTIVNITSVGGKISVPHLIPYSCAKFAAVALSEGLRAELAADGIKVLTVVPGLMRTGSFINAFFKGQREREYAWFTASDNLPLLSISPGRAARSVVRAVRKRRSEIVLSVPAKAIILLHALFPQLAQRVFGLAARMLPAPSEEGNAALPGSEVAARNEGTVVRLATRTGTRAINRYQWGQTTPRGA